MTGISHRKRIWGWFFFDWASQPYNTLLITFIFGPYIKELLSDGAAAQAAWGYTIGLAGAVIAVTAPFLGAMADKGGHRIGWVGAFSLLYVVGSAGAWFADPGGFNLLLILGLFGIGLIGMEFATIFTNSLLPDLGDANEIGGISGSGWAFGYVGGLIALVLMLFFFAESAEGTTLLGLAPAFGLDPVAREGTRFVGPFTALWYILFMIPFFLWVKEPANHATVPLRQAAKDAWPELRSTLRALPQTPSLFAFLGSSMLYRDALNGLYIFGGLYAAGVLGWGVIDTGIFGIISVIAAALFAWLGGMADNRFGPKPLIICCVLILTAICIAVIFVSRESVFGVAVAAESTLPDLVFYAMGASIGAAGGALQSASRTMMCRQSDPERMTQAFGLYALAGKATAFMAPLAIGVVTDITRSQQLGILPLIILFGLGLVLLVWVKPNGERAACPPSDLPASRG
ncbi:MFS transporter [Aliiruegeria sabulilitoris]|uniref:MFS transporter n=1 Tax=Aliiruegeria sabulilitoris TaxID=1510458 RepID=UPI000834E95B|nr:MFS transporter [Aliiruegeria sabulilitoris]NDR57683.1 MFS transporter [Pseudoruegeria sp. M32A2M]